MTRPTAAGIILAAISLAVMPLYFLLLAPKIALIDEARKEQSQVITRLSQLQERIAKLAGKSRGDLVDPRDMWLSEERNISERLMQARVVEIAELSGLTVDRFNQSTLTKPEKQFLIGLNLELHGTLENLTKFLALVESNTPRISVFEMTLRPARGRRGEQGATLVVAHFVLRGLVKPDAPAS